MSALEIMENSAGTKTSKRPVVCKLRGGLGNQLFQFAAGAALAHRLKTPLRLDITELKRDPKRFFELDYLADVNRYPLIDENVPPSALSRLMSAFRLTQRLPSRVFVEAGFEFDERFLRVSEGVRLDGYFQSYKYFQDLPAANLAQLIPPENSQSQEMENQIRAAFAVAVHIRRGDYVSESHTNSFHGVMSSAYYEEGARIIIQRRPEAKFFVFSDEPEWVRKNFAFPYPFVAVDVASGPSGKTDLRLMAKCRHHLIANSTLSWWAAYLGATPEQVVVAPKKWFAQAQLNDRDLIPPHWVRI